MYTNRWPHSVQCTECGQRLTIYTSYAGQAASAHKSLCSSSFPPKVWQWMRESAAMTRMMPGAAEVMAELSPVPLLQRRSASEARWHEPVSASREKKFRERPLLSLPKTEGAPYSCTV